MGRCPGSNPAIRVVGRAQEPLANLVGHPHSVRGGRVRLAMPDGVASIRAASAGHAALANEAEMLRALSMPATASHPRTPNGQRSQVSQDPTDGQLHGTAHRTPERGRQDLDLVGPVRAHPCWRRACRDRLGGDSVSRGRAERVLQGTQDTAPQRCIHHPLQPLPSAVLLGRNDQRHAGFPKRFLLAGRMQRDDGQVPYSSGGG